LTRKMNHIQNRFVNKLLTL